MFVRINTSWYINFEQDVFMYYFLWIFQVKKAFFALVYNGVRAAPLWDNEKQDFIGKWWKGQFTSAIVRIVGVPM